MPPTPPATPDHEWLRTEWCLTCQYDTDHEYVLWQDEALVTRTCLECEKVITHWDTV